MNSNQLNNNTVVSLFVKDIKNQKLISETAYSIANQNLMPDVVLFYKDLSDSDISTLENLLKNPTLEVQKQDPEDKDKIINETFSAERGLNYKLIKTESNTFAKLFNETFNYANENGYEYMSVIECGDIIGRNWFSLVKTYASEIEETSIFFPISRVTTNGIFTGLINEAPWAEGMAEEAGRLDMNLISRFNCVSPLGTTFKVASIRDDGNSEIKDNGKYYPMKESLRLSSTYEFFLRMIYNDLKTITIPRIGYESRNQILPEYDEISSKIPQNICSLEVDKGGFSDKEANFWMELAKKEYFFDKDRNKTYVE